MSHKGPASEEAMIVGAFEHPLRVAPQHSALRFSAECAKAALDDAGLRPEDVDGLCVTGDSMAPVYVADYLNLSPSWIESSGIGGPSPLLHVLHARDAVRAGTARVVIITYGSTARSSAAAFGTTGRPQTADPMGVDDFNAFDAPYGVVLAAQYAMVANRHMHEFGTTHEQLAAIAVACRSHAALNTNALYRDPITVDDVLASRPIASPLHLLDCCVISDGGGAVVVAHPDVAADCRTKPVAVLGGGQALAHGEAGRRSIIHVGAEQSGPRALTEAGIGMDDVDFCMLYDSFTITVLSTLEGLGFCKIGEGGSFVEGGRLQLSGDLPINLDGGALSSNHPGRRGIFLLVEATRQLRNECGSRQVLNARIGLCHGTGGFLSGRHSATTVILGAS
jgi:acetyl-CoA C-acetyltransferase